MKFVGELLGFQFYAQAVRPIQIGIYRPVAGCSFVLLKSYTPWVANVGFTTVRILMHTFFCIMHGRNDGC